ncbi:MAG: ferrous iron transport protein A [Thermaurantimonas sp.]|uniref:FeoA family protein n=1 Tax=Thermaurantimonas sp. TaxID=2681568 RepID=UPI00391DC1A7
MNTLASMEPGQTAVICENGFENIPLKLLEMGFLPGIEVKMIRRAPLSDPICVQVNGSYLVIREETAVQIKVNTKK